MMMYMDVHVSSGHNTLVRNNGLGNRRLELALDVLQIHDEISSSLVEEGHEVLHKILNTDLDNIDS